MLFVRSLLVLVLLAVFAAPLRAEDAFSRYAALTGASPMARVTLAGRLAYSYEVRLAYEREAVALYRQLNPNTHPDYRPTLTLDQAARVVDGCVTATSVMSGQGFELRYGHVVATCIVQLGVL